MRELFLRRRSKLLAMAMIAGVSVCGLFPATESTTAADTPDWTQVDWDEWSTANELLENVRQVSGVPAIAAVIVRDTGILDFATVGVREFGTQQTVGPDDRFHIGSITKSMTATMIGKLVENGLLTWTTTIASVLPEIPMRDEYRNVTIEQLLHHESGLPTFTSSREYQELAMQGYSGTSTEKRTAFLSEVLKLDPAGEPGNAALYSNAGYALAGYLAERVTGRSWESLITTHIFEPLGMTHSGFGHPGTKGVPNEPRGHDGTGTRFVPLADDDHPPMDIIAPAGDVHCSVRDLARYAQFHLDGMNSDDGYLRAKTIKRLHTLSEITSDMRYASGWIVRTEPSGESIHYHGGTTGSFYAELKLYPDRNAATAVLMNVGLDPGELVANKVARALMARYSPDRVFTAGSTSAGPGQPTLSFESKSSDASVGQWNAQGSGGAIKVAKGAAPTEADDDRTWAMLKRLAETINDEDRDGFLSLFARNEESSQSVFEFMAGQVLPSRGGIRSFHDLSDPLVVETSEFPVRTVIFHLDNGYPGYFGISIDENGKIDDFSLFVMGNLCPNGPDTQCDMSTKTLGKDL